MCWGFKVFVKVFGNLAGRIFRDALDATYKICAVCICNSKNTVNAENKLGECFIFRDASYSQRDFNPLMLKNRGHFSEVNSFLR